MTRKNAPDCRAESLMIKDIRATVLAPPHRPVPDSMSWFIPRLCSKRSGHSSINANARQTAATNHATHPMVAAERALTLARPTHASRCVAMSI
jgi:hypothetical protein